MTSRCSDKKNRMKREWYYERGGKEKESAYNRVYRQTHKEQIERYRKDHREQALVRMKARYQAHREQELVRMKEHYQGRREGETQERRENRIKVLQAYGGNPPKCACCGENHVEFLQIDHTNGGGNKHRKQVGTSGGGRFYLWLIKNNFPDGFRVLCANCNLSRGFYGYCPHEREVMK